ncbi:Inosine-uridine nucleoside N-ribohydrolase [Cyclobacterium lianum]|uniref:Inosine-uridine nucleoside N-ribohydrolase n=1 Tax=Cyclobacterium lianum TaxID=388280 RepID=A0A1M7L4W9_9BACT|nr:nucleoside hydrolase [Cyclobacterium lianum]SHM73101.1 Inosine-uridine nucleoside N-ribohydrolase [Cyclobacterium lianum]
MKTLLLSFATLICAVTAYAQPTKVILDTDLDSAVDDVGTMAILHNLADHGRLEILGIVVTSNDRYAPQCADAINHYFKRPTIPIGVEKGIPLKDVSKYTGEISRNFSHRLKAYGEAEDATRLYRSLLAGETDGAVVIVTVGHLTNLKHLIQSGPDEISELSGLELIRKKVKLWACMGGQFPEGKEANFYRPDPESTQIAVNTWPGRVIFSGWEIGNEIITGGPYLKKSIAPESPVYQAYRLFNDFSGRQSWDQSILLYLVSPEKYWDLGPKGNAVVYQDGSNTWKMDKNGQQQYLLPKMAAGEIAKVLDALMVGIYRPAF